MISLMLRIVSRLMRSLLAYMMYLTVLAPSISWAGPPFVTDDPEPVEYHHREFYASVQYSNNKRGKFGTLPLFEFNEGIAPQVQVHILVPFAYNKPYGGPILYGFGDTEVGKNFVSSKRAGRYPRWPRSHSFISQLVMLIEVSGMVICPFFSLSGCRKVGGHGRLTVVADTGSILGEAIRTSSSLVGWDSVIFQEP